MEWIYVICYHTLVVVGIVLIAIGASAIEGSNAAPKSSDETLLKVGIVVLLVAWVVLVGWVGLSLLPSQIQYGVAGLREGTIVS